MLKNETFNYEGKEATVSWNGPLCIHVGECGGAKGNLFVGGRNPWCQPDAASSEEVTEVVLRCPTGALSVNFADGSNLEQPHHAIRYKSPITDRFLFAVSSISKMDRRIFLG
jgi:uncharacterized Fe-S cluster protein YjdI